MNTQHHARSPNKYHRYEFPTYLNVWNIEASLLNQTKSIDYLTLTIELQKLVGWFCQSIQRLSVTTSINHVLKEPTSPSKKSSRGVKLSKAAGIEN